MLPHLPNASPQHGPCLLPHSDINEKKKVSIEIYMTEGVNVENSSAFLFHAHVHSGSLSAKVSGLNSSDYDPLLQ